MELIDITSGMQQWDAAASANFQTLVEFFKVDNLVLLDFPANLAAFDDVLNWNFAKLNALLGVTLNTIYPKKKGWDSVLQANFAAIESYINSNPRPTYEMSFTVGSDQVVENCVYRMPNGKDALFLIDAMALPGDPYNRWLMQFVLPWGQTMPSLGSLSPHQTWTRISYPNGVTPPATLEVFDASAV